MVDAQPSFKRVSRALLVVTLLSSALSLWLRGPWLTVVWALQAAVFVWAGLLFRAPGWRRAGILARWGGFVLFAVAALRLMAWGAMPRIFGQPLPGMALRSTIYLLCVVAFYLAIWGCVRFRGEPQVTTLLVVAASLVTLWYITLEIVLHFDLREGGLGMGNREMLISAAWGLYGMLFALVDRRFPHQTLRDGTRLLLVAALGYLLLGAMQNNGRWAAISVRYFAYLSVLGSVWGSELLFRRYEVSGERNGLLSFMAALAGAMICSFEVERWMEPVFKSVARHGLDGRTYIWQESTARFWRMSAWGFYSLLVTAVGLWLRSNWTRMAGAAIAAVSLLAFLFSDGALETAASLRLLAFGFAAVGAGLLLFVGLKAPGGRLRYEGAMLKALGVLAAIVALRWAALELF